MRTLGPSMLLEITGQRSFHRALGAMMEAFRPYPHRLLQLQRDENIEPATGLLFPQYAEGLAITCLTFPYTQRGLDITQCVTEQHVRPAVNAVYRRLLESPEDETLTSYAPEVSLLDTTTAAQEIEASNTFQNGLLEMVGFTRYAAFQMGLQMGLMRQTPEQIRRALSLLTSAAIDITSAGLPISLAVPTHIEGFSTQEFETWSQEMVPYVRADHVAPAMREVTDYFGLSI